MEEIQFPKAKGVTSNILGENSNVFNLISIVSRDLRKAGYHDLDKEFKDKCFRAKSYDEVLMIIQTYVDVS
ncbi:MAG: hypothetical protein WCF96_09525 [Eubacteriales bacterium]